MAMASGITTLDILIRESGWERLEQIGAQVERSLLPVLREAPFPIHFVRTGSLFWMSFHDAAAEKYARAVKVEDEVSRKLAERVAKPGDSERERWFKRLDEADHPAGPAHPGG